MSQVLRSLCVYCGSSTGALPLYAEAARSLAQEMSSRNIALVYGGGRIGLMGVLADEMLRLGGTVTGVIPEQLMAREVGHTGLTQLHVVKDMHERKALMAELSDGFIAMPGGMGTLEELFEALTWSQLGLHRKPVGLLNVGGFYDGLIAFIGNLMSQGFLASEHAALLLNETQPQALLHRFQHHLPSIPSDALDPAAARAILP
jgi:uncharacterized protein (TIGR00730 family)